MAGDQGAFCGRLSCPVAGACSRRARRDAEQGHAHDIAGADHHDSGDHDHVSAALLAASGTAVQPPPERTLRPETRASDGTIRDGPRRPPRLTVI
jgi:hypothetical protein